MHNNEFSRHFFKLLRNSTNILPILFWLLLIYAFDDSHTASHTVGSAVIHEAGHLTCALMLNKSAKLRGALSGFRISGIKHIGYKEELALYLSGPLINIICAALCLIPNFGREPDGFAAINIATAIVNLLPIKGQDGYGIARVLIQMNCDSPSPIRILDDISFALVAFLTLFALYLMQKCDAGYWICGIFLVSIISEMERRLS